MRIQRSFAVLAVAMAFGACSRSSSDSAPRPMPAPPFVGTVTAAITATAETTDPVDVAALNLTGLDAEDETAFNALLGI